VLAIAVCGNAVLVRCAAPGKVNQKQTVDAVSRDLLTAGLAFVAPTLAFLAVMVAFGTLDSFLAEPVAFITTYLGTGNEPASEYGVSTWDRLVPVARIVGQHLGAFLWTIPGLVAIWELRATASPRLRVMGVAVLTGPSLAALATLLVVYPILGHYANFLYGATMLGAMAAVGLANVVQPVPEPGRQPRNRRLALALPALLAVGLAVGAVARLPTIQRNVSSVISGMLHPGPSPSASSSVAEACPPGSRVLVWGWASELYAEFDWAPASRYVYTWYLFGWGRSAYYRETMEAEVANAPPTCIVEALGPAFFGRLDASDAITVKASALAASLASCYERTPAMLPGARPVTLWRWTGQCAQSEKPPTARAGGGASP
jgi:hypothetical protein